MKKKKQPTRAKKPKPEKSDAQKLRLEKAERLRRFINAVGAGKEPDLFDKLAAIQVCADEMRRLKGGRPARKRYPIGTPQFTVAVRWQLGEITTEQAKEELCHLVDGTQDAYDEATADKHLKEMEPRALKWIHAFDGMEHRHE